MKSSLRGTSVIALLTAAFSAGCGKSLTESVCAKGTACNAYDKDQTEAQCVTTLDKTSSAYHDDTNCKEVAEKFDAYLECKAALACADLKDPDSEYNKCKQQVDDLNATRSKDAKTCAAAGH